MVSISQGAAQLEMTFVRFRVLVFLLWVSLKIITSVENGKILAAESTRPVRADDCPQAHYSNIVMSFL